MEKRVLISRWLGPGTQALPVYDEASVSSARQRVREIGSTFNGSKALVESAVLIASELTHNQLAHSRQGYFAVKAIERGEVKGLEVVAADIGPGLQKTVLTGAGAVREGSSLGAGLEGVFRLADEVDIDTRGAEGLCVVARKFEAQAVPFCEVAICGTPCPGEVISGDDATCFQSESGLLAAVCDGLGHGPEAREASNAAVESISRHRDQDLRELVLAVNKEIAGTRGCTLTVVRFNAGSRMLQCLSAGDIRAQLYHVRDAHFFTPSPLVVGDRQLPARRLHVEEVSVAPGSVLAMFTDGLQSRTNVKGDLDLLRRPAVTIAQQLIERHARLTDDALAFVARFRN
jgi:anti-sigma regulatory factor (Ser/Thr protein kinase)